LFERFTDRARRVVVLAQEEARMLDHGYIGTEHILLGLIHEGDGVAAKALRALGISLQAVRGEVEELIGRGQAAQTGHIPFTPRAKKVLELSLREALTLGHDYIGTEHILLGLIREGEGVAAQVLQKLGADLNRVRQQVIQLLSGYGPMSEREPGDPSEGRPFPWPFTERALRVLELARESSHDLHHPAIEPAAILLALVVTDDTEVVELFDAWGIDRAEVRRRIMDLAEEEDREEADGPGAPNCGSPT
jgi:ATP-dependent Clp protease ATP-binding subunit ClpA